MNNSSWFWPDVNNVEEAKKAVEIALRLEEYEDPAVIRK